MTFFEKYAELCDMKGIEPCSQRTAELLGTTRSTISIWKKNGTVPRGETVAVIADKFHVSADYLLGRTIDPKDHAKGDTEESCMSKSQNTYAAILKLYDRLDEIDRMRLESYAEGILTGDKYRTRNKSTPLEEEGDNE